MIKKKQQTNKQTNKKQEKKIKKKKEYLWKIQRIICSMYFQLTWSSREFFLVVHTSLMWLMCNERSNDSICYTTTSYEVHTFNNKNERKIIKRNFCLSFSPLYMLILSCKFVIIERRAYEKAHDENARTS